MQMLTDEELIVGCNNGNERYKTQLYYRYSPSLFGVALRYTRNEADAQDVLQDAFIKIFDSLEQYKGTGTLKAWLTRIVINKALQYYKKQKRQQDVVDSYEDNLYQIEDESINYSDKLSQQVLLNFIQSLPDGYRMVFNLCEIEGYSYDEVAAMLQCSNSNCRSQLFKAKRILKQKVNDFLKKEVL